MANSSQEKTTTLEFSDVDWFELSKEKLHEACIDAAMDVADWNYVVYWGYEVELLK